MQIIKTGKIYLSDDNRACQPFVVRKEDGTVSTYLEYRVSMYDEKDGLKTWKEMKSRIIYETTHAFYTFDTQNDKNRQLKNLATRLIYGVYPIYNSEYVKEDIDPYEMFGLQKEKIDIDALMTEEQFQKLKQTISKRSYRILVKRKLEYRLRYAYNVCPRKDRPYVLFVYGGDDSSYTRSLKSIKIVSRLLRELKHYAHDETWLQDTLSSAMEFTN